MKRGLDHPALAKMKRSLAREQTLTKQVLRTLQRTSLHELVCVDDEQIAVNFKGPGYTSDAVIDRASGSYDVTETRMGWGAVINDLHKGRDAGRAWATLIDAAAVFMTLVSVTGLSLIFFLAKWRRSGLVMLAAGAAVSYALYLIFVP